MDDYRVFVKGYYFTVVDKKEKPSRYLLTKKDLTNFINYCGTRETVFLNMEQKQKDMPSTVNQQKILSELYKRADTYKDTLEYRKYMNSPTVRNAEELISLLTENTILNGRFDEVYDIIDNLKENNTKVSPNTHGLFSNYDVDIIKLRKELPEHKGRIWNYIISLKREDAERLGYNFQEPWKDMIMSNLDAIAQCHNIKLNNLRWFAAMHNTTHHPHIHLFVYSTDPDEGFFPQKKFKNRDRLKEKFEEHIFKNEEYFVFQEDKNRMQRLKELTAKAVDSLKTDCMKEYKEGTKKLLIDKIMTLAENINLNKDPLYVCQTKESKELICDILSAAIYESPSLSSLYKEWCNLQYNVGKVYIEDPKMAPIEMNRDFGSLKTEIIKFTKKLRLETEFSEIMVPEKSINEYLSDYTEYQSKDSALMIGYMLNYGIKCERDLDLSHQWYVKANDNIKADNVIRQKNLTVTNIGNLINRFIKIINLEPQNMSLYQNMSDKKAKANEQRLKRSNGQNRNDHSQSTFEY